MRRRLDEQEKELESARRERDAVRAGGPGGATGDGAAESAPGDDGDVAELETEVRPDIRRLESVYFSLYDSVASLSVLYIICSFQPW